MLVNKYSALLVDDDRTFQGIAAAILRDVGFSVEKAFSGLEAIAKAKAQTFDVIFMDCNMPEPDGFETTQRIRALEGGSRDSTIVALSGALESEEIIRKCLESGMNDCIAKPLRPEQLRSRMKRWGLSSLGATSS